LYISQQISLHSIPTFLDIGIFFLKKNLKISAPKFQIVRFQMGRFYTDKIDGGMPGYPWYSIGVRLVWSLAILVAL
jgi:hypothetical protein